MKKDSQLKALHWTCNAVATILLVLLVVWCYLWWANTRDAALKQIEQNESKASFKAQIVTTDNGIQIFIREIDGKIYGNIVNQEP